MTTTSSSTVRPPLQERSRAGWARVLDAGLALLEENGPDALTISEVCRRAAVSAPSLYARVDGRDGLFVAVYEHGMAAVTRTEDTVLGASGSSVKEVIDAVAQVFETHRAFLRTAIVSAPGRPELLSRGGQESRRFVERIACVLQHPADIEDARLVARIIYEAVSFRTLYGDTFWNPAGESRGEFVGNTTRVAEAIFSPPAAAGGR